MIRFLFKAHLVIAAFVVISLIHAYHPPAVALASIPVLLHPGRWFPLVVVLSFTAAAVGSAVASTAIPRPLPTKLTPVPTAAAKAAPIEQPLAVATMRWNRYWGSFSSPSANSTQPRNPPPRQGAVSPLDRYCPTGRRYLFLVFPNAVSRLRT